MKSHPSIIAASLFAIAGIVIVLLIWLVGFSGQPWSSDSAQLARFGSCFAGTLGPISAFASFLGILVSVQHHQANQAQLESRADA